MWCHATSSRRLGAVQRCIGVGSISLVAVTPALTVAQISKPAATPGCGRDSFNMHTDPFMNGCTEPNQHLSIHFGRPSYINGMNKTRVRNHLFSSHLSKGWIVPSDCQTTASRNQGFGRKTGG